MTSGSSRKRPAPGTVPISHQQTPNYPVVDSPLSNDQFLQWGQTSPSMINPPADMNIGSYQSINHLGDVTGLQTPNQLARRSANLMVSRARTKDPALMSLMDPPPRPGETIDPATGETEEELMRRALAAKKDAQAKRKQIPPFVQKLSR